VTDDERIEQFMQNNRTKRLVRELSEKLEKAKARRQRSTLVPLEVLDRLLTRIESS
jgi:hypothetical protein